MSKSKVNAEKSAVKPPKHKGLSIPYERRKALYGYGFIAIWAIGAIYFFILPVVKSLIYSFYATSQVEAGGLALSGFGLDNYVEAFRKDTKFLGYLKDVLQNTALKTPLILIFSIFVAVILNQKFKGRAFARSVFFLPVIIATGPVYSIITGDLSNGGYSGGSEQFSTMFETNLVDQLLQYVGIYNMSDALVTTINAVITEIFSLVWTSGIQILLFLSALQNIPFSAKEAAQMEGATAWEYFWKITIPYISPMILTALVYTIVDSFIDPTNDVMNRVLQMSTVEWRFGYSAAMAWIYFAIVGIALAIIVAIVNKFVYYEVE